MEENKNRQSEEEVLADAVQEPAGDTADEDGAGTASAENGGNEAGAASAENGGDEAEAASAEDGSAETDAGSADDAGKVDSVSAEDTEGKADSTEEKPLFGRKKKKDKKDEKIEELTDRVQRQMAEFDNYRKRTEKEKSQMFEMGAKSVLEKLLPVVDNFERGLAAIDESEKDGSVASGMDMIYKQLAAMLEESGVKPIQAEGAQFDPDFHNAVMHVEDEAFGENVVAEELQKGYMYRDTVLRYSMVKVAN